MKNRALQRLLFVISLGMILGGMAASSIYAAENLGKKHAGMGITCAQCHGEVKKKQAVPMIICLNCHDTKKLAEKTAQAKPNNPHQNRHYGTEGDCNLCHHQHKKSENFCLPCHARFKFVVP